MSWLTRLQKILSLRPQRSSNRPQKDMTDAALHTSPSGLICTDAALMRMAYRVRDSLVDERLEEAACEVRKLLAAYPDHLWSHELHEAYLLYARDLFPPENHLSTPAFLAAHIHTLERMLALNC